MAVNKQHSQTSRDLQELVTFRPDDVYLSGLYSSNDEGVIRAFYGDRHSADPSQIIRIAGKLAFLLRLMDEFVSGHRSGQDFTSTFSNYWASLPLEAAERELEVELDKFEEFYEAIQFFSAEAAHRQEEPLLFDEADLRKLTHSRYEFLKNGWLSLITGSC